MRLKACINGARTDAVVPKTASEIADATASSIAAGADGIHLHPKGSDGRDSLDGPTTDAAVTAARAVAGDVPIGVTTGAWSTPDVDSRLAAIRSWTVLPDFASVNWHEDGADEVAQLLLERGVAVEAGLWNLDAVTAFARSPARDACVRILVELQRTDSVSVADEMIAALGSTSTPLLLHGVDESTWPAIEYAAKLDMATRIGIEDTLLLPDGSPAPDNAALVRAAIELTHH